MPNLPKIFSAGPSHFSSTAAQCVNRFIVKVLLGKRLSIELYSHLDKPHPDRVARRSAGSNGQKSIICAFP
jgi:hypothetical protein